MDIKNYNSNNSELTELTANVKTPKRREIHIIFGKNDNELWESLINIERKKLPMVTFIKQAANFVINEIKNGRNPLL